MIGLTLDTPIYWCLQRSMRIICGVNLVDDMDIDTQLDFQSQLGWFDNTLDKE